MDTEESNKGQVGLVVVIGTVIICNNTHVRDYHIYCCVYSSIDYSIVVTAYLYYPLYLHALCVEGRCSHNQ